MKTKKLPDIVGKIFAIASKFFATAMTLCALFLIIGEIFAPDERDPLDKRVQYMNSGWYRVWEDGSKEAIEVPCNLDVPRGELVTIGMIIPDEVRNGDYICFRPVWQDVRVRVDGETRAVHDLSESRPFGTNSAFKYVFTELREEDAGKELTYTFTSDSKYSGKIRSIYYGDRSGIWMEIASGSGLKSATALSMGIMGIFCIITCLVLRIALKKPLELRFLAWSLFLCAWWMLSEIEFRQLMVKNISIWTNTTYWSLMLIVFPLLLYINEIQKGYYKKIYTLPLVYMMCVSVIGTLLQVFDIMQFVTQLPFIHGGLAAAIICIIATLTIDTFNGRLKDYMLVGVGIYGLLLSAIIEILFYYLQIDLSLGTILAVGLMFLLVMAIIKTGKDLLATEKNKQEAIVAREAQAKFLANMSHEIRTPINAVIGMNEMILRENEDETVEGYALNIQRASNMLLELVNEILDFSKIESGQLEIVDGKYCLADIIRDEKLLLDTRIGEKPIDIQIEVDPKIPNILFGDEVRMKQILTNLLSNAAKYTEKGTITLKVFFQWINSEKISLCFQIKDTGRGIKEEDLPTLFDEFRRLDLDKNRNVEGSGLGLNIVKQLVYLMQGNIYVDSEYGKGSTFTVFIPQKVLDNVPIGNYEQSVRKKVAGNKKAKTQFTAPDAKVLVVDDNAMNLTLMKALLKRTCMEVDTATSGKECLNLTRQKKYHIILMDHMMPGMDGVETLHKLRAESDNLNRKTVVIALTANAVAGSREMYLEYGFDNYFAKPIQADKLDEMLVNYLPPEVIHIEYDNKTASVEEKANTTAEEKGNNSELLAIDRELGLSYCMETEELYKEVLQEFCVQMEEYFPQIENYFQNENWSDYAVIAHAVKSNSRTIGATAFADLSFKHECAGKTGDVTFIHEGYAEYISLLKELVKNVKEML